jgi:ATPase family associated with various cellular activities (AAA)
VSVTAPPRADRLALELERVRLLVRRRMLWLRASWSDDLLRGTGRFVVSDAQADALASPADPFAEAAFYREHEPAAALSEAIAALERELADGGVEPDPLDLLVARLGLTEDDRELLVLALAPELDPTFERLYAYVHDDAGRRFATPHLASELLGPAVLPRLASEAPLRRFGLLALAATDDGWGSRPLRVDERVLWHLRGLESLDPQVAKLLRPIRDPAPLGSALVVAKRLAELLADRSPWPLVQIVGPSHAGRRAVGAAACAKLRLRLVALAPDAAELCRERSELSELLEREAALLSLAFWIDDLSVDGWRGLAERLGAPVLLGGEERLRTDAPLLAVPLGPPTGAELRDRWASVLGPGIDPEPLAQQFELEPREMAAAVIDADARAALRGADAPEAGDVWAACRARARVQADGLAHPIDASDCWNRLVLPDDALAQLGELAAQAAHRARVYDEWGFGPRLPRGRGVTALFTGPSGTGKTMAAEALAARLGLDLYAADLAGVVSKWIGETEKNLRRIFDAAEHAGAVLFFDEAEALFGKRTEVKDAHDRYANIEVDYLLQRMEEYRGVAILATNRRALVDPAFLRRLRFLIEFPFPDRAARELLWRGVFPEDVPLGELDWEALARLEVSGGSIRTIAVNATFIAAAEDQPVAMDQVMRAARREYAKLERLIVPAEFGAFA